MICHQFNDQMLMLQCVHDPCINCAAVHYAEEFKGKLKNYVPPTRLSTTLANSVEKERHLTLVASSS